MATAYKVLGQVAPAATTSTAVYTVPSATEAVVSSVTVCNRAGASATFRLAVRPNGATLANEHYLVYDTSLAANDTIVLTIGVTMDAADVLEAYASSGDLTFHAYGSEIS
jgi:hypothetical protein